MALIERRRYPRKDINLVLDYRSQNFYQYKIGSDVSLRGLFIQTDKTEPTGAKVNLIIYFPQEKTGFTAKGKVVWRRQINERLPDGNVRPAGMGIELGELNKMLKDKIQGLFKG